MSELLPTPAPTTTSKPGYKTTEFWLTCVAMLLGVLWSSGAVSEGGQVDKVMGFIATVLSQFGYTVSRGIAKSGDAKKLVAPTPTK